ncbi:carboxymuconolactone decarboxylase family protein [Rhizorhabdus dicambivorans]|uniref:Carboxymuconolactone decarboxylase family protein n=1 Tax=Rhizorhabdus dicambivorans TaxID=1850238 RepID=A0A2A4FTS2_9SPHN|nr:hypothetical protein [Rhizorhabdus dicambivorans]ATE66415.1 hypothetical protein CMV14_20055 [Rhizorhabdus dicambivorans]PCE41094.1 hypothetical protein COO09_17265 [Rhizorhabdus dicambivorans]
MDPLMASQAFPPVPLDPDNADQRALADQLLRASGGYAGGPIPLLLRSPAMGLRLRPLISYFATRSTLPARLKELAILIQARFWDQDYEWWAHERIAHDAGLAPAVTAAIHEGRFPENMAEDEAAVHALCRELLDEHRVRPETLAEARRHLNEEQLVDLAAVSGVYALLALLLNLSGEGAPADAPRPTPGI